MGIVKNDRTVGKQMKKRVILAVGKIIIDQTVRPFVQIRGVNARDEQIVRLSRISIVSSSDRCRSIDENVLFALVVQGVVERRMMIVFIADMDLNFSLTRLLRFVIQRIDVEVIE